VHTRRAFALTVLGVLVLAIGGGALIAFGPTDDGVTSACADNGTFPGAGSAPADADPDAEATVVFYRCYDPVATVHGPVSDTHSERYTGLSEHDSLADDEGMLFVYDEPDDLTYVMRRMDFGIDIVYVDEDGCVTDVHAAPRPGPDEDGSEQEYPGYGQYVVEVPIGVATDAGIAEGDPVWIQYDGTVVDGRGDCFDS